MKQETILEKRRRQSDRIRQMTVAAMLSAITALLVFTPIGMIQLPPPLLAVTTVHVPVLIAALVEGWWVGGFVGLVFGVCSLIRAWESGAGGPDAVLPQSADQCPAAHFIPAGSLRGVSLAEKALSGRTGTR